MRKQIIIASGNKGKVQEVREILAELDVEIVSMHEAGVNMEIDETGSTFAENAAIKAKAVAECTGGIVLADDSGLEIDYLNKEPGIYSARYMGETTPYTIKNAALIERLKDAKEAERSARFICAIAVVFPDGELLSTAGTIEGRIAYEEKGSNGFGYDPIFYLPEYEKTTAQLSEKEKNRISHRGKALEQMKKLLFEKLKD